MLLLAACSTTSHLPEGETLYTGIGVVSYVDQGGKDRNGIRRYVTEVWAESLELLSPKPQTPAPNS